MRMSDRTRQASMLGLWVLLFALGSFFAFRAQHAYLLQGLDGAYTAELSLSQRRWLPPWPGFSNNFLQSLGNVWFPLNTWFEPAFVLATSLDKSTVDEPLLYLIFALELLGGTFALALALGQTRLPALLTAMFLVIGTFPYFGAPLLKGNMTLVPQMGTGLASFAMCLTLIRYLGQAGTAGNIACALGIFALALHLALSQIAVFSALVAPLLVPFVVGRVAFSSKGKERAWVTGGVLAIGGLLLAIGIPALMLGMFRYTAVNFFRHDFIEERHTWDHVSILFQSGTLIAPALFFFAIAGAVRSLIAARGPARVFAGCFLLLPVLLFSLGYICVYLGSWRGPMPAYYEEILLPLYAVYAAFALQWLHRLTAQQLGLGGAVAIATLVMVCTVRWASPSVVKLEYVYPPKLSPIAELLRREVGLLPGETFRGRVATLVGSKLPSPARWIEVHGMDNQLVHTTGNDHRMVGLWHYGIPTLVEYNPFITPVFHLWMKEFFTPPGDLQTRNIVMIRRVRPKLLAAIGIRFVISDEELVAGKERLRLAHPDGGDLYLNELEWPNIGSYSPTVPLVSTTARGALDLLAADSFEPRKQVVLEEALNAELSAIERGSLIVERGNLRVSATSSGTSLMLLPLEYSHCLQLGASEGNARLLRGNLLQAAVLFSGSLDARLTYFTGLLDNAGCRLRDTDDMRRLALSEAAPRRAAER